MQTACEFVKRVVELKAKKTYTDKEAVQLILLNTARDELQKKGTTKYECSISESSDIGPKGKVEPTKKRGSQR